MRIFLSYAREDEQIVARVYDYLTSIGQRPWMDRRSLIGGVAWKEEIELEIKRCDMFFIFLSPRSVQKRGILQIEIRTALDKAREFLPDSIFIVPIVIEECEIPDQLAKYQWIDLVAEDWRTKIAQSVAKAEQRRPGLRIFLSYAREDEQTVVQVYDYLASIGQRPWMDIRNLIAGDPWKKEIEFQIRRCDMFFIFLSPRSVQKTGILKEEIRTALDRARRFLPDDVTFIVPVFVDKCEAPAQLAKYHWIDLRDEDWKTKTSQTVAKAQQQRSDSVSYGLGTPKTAIGELNGNSGLRGYTGLGLGAITSLLLALNIFVTALNVSVGLLLAGFALVMLVVLALSPRVRSDRILFQVTFIISVGAAATLIHLAVISRTELRPEPQIQATLHDLLESAAATEACGNNLTLACMVAGGVRAEAAAGRHLMACTTATMLQSDDPSLAWKDVWTTSVYSYAPGGGGPGGGRDDDELKIGGWGDDYYTLISFALPTLAFQPKFAAIILYSKEADVASTRLAIDRIAQAWDFPKGDRLWWKDRPRTFPTDMQVLLAPGRKQWYMIELTSLVDSWRSNTFANHGIEIRPLETNNNYVFFVSSDASDKSKIPRLLFCP